MSKMITLENLAEFLAKGDAHWLVRGDYDATTGVGYAELANNLVATKGLTVNDDPMSFGIVGGEQKSAVGDGNATMNKLVGVTLVRNQWIIGLTHGTLPAGTTTKNGITFEVSNHSVRAYGTCTAEFIQNIINANLSGKGRVLLYYGAKSVSGKYRIGNFNDGNSIVYDKEGVILIASATTCTFGIQIYSGATIDITFTFKAISLTQRYGSTDVANAIIGPAVSQWFARLLAADPEILSDTDYDAGTLVPSKSAKLLSVGVNQWDEEYLVGEYNSSTGEYSSAGGKIVSKNRIRVKGNTEYHFRTPSTYPIGSGIFVFFYDASGNYISRYSSYVWSGLNFTTPENCAFINIQLNQPYGATYNHDICINVSDPSINGKYYPFKRNPIALPNVELNGILKVVDGKVVADGDELYPDGNSKKRYTKFTFAGNETWTFRSSDTNCDYYTSSTTFLPEPAKGDNASYLVCSNGYQRGNAYNGNTPYLIQITTRRIYLAVPTGANPNTVFSSGTVLSYELATPEDIETTPFQSTFPVEQGGTLQFLDEDDNPIAGLQGSEIFYQKNIKAFVEAFGEAIDWNPERIERLANLSFTPEYVDITLDPSPTGAYARAQVYNATFTIVISAALTGTAGGSITFQDSEVDLSDFKTKPADSIIDMDGKKVSEAPTTTDCNIASFVGRSKSGIVLWSLLHSGVNKVKIHIEEAVPLDSSGNGKIDCRASLIL